MMGTLQPSTKERKLRNDRSLQRLLLNKELSRHLPKLKGRVLDTGGKHSPYRDLISCKRYEVLDISPEFAPDYVADVHDMRMIRKETFDGILATELLEHCQEPQRVVDEFHRVLRPGGAVLLSVPFFYPYHPDPKDYYRYTKDGLAYLFRAYRSVEVSGYGGRLAFFWEMATWALPPLKAFNVLLAKVNLKDRNGPSGYVVLARR